MFAFLAAALLCCVGLFLPAGQLDLTGKSMIAPATISLYKLGKSDEAVQDFLHGYRSSTSKKVGRKVLDKVAPHLKGRVASDASDVQDAMAALDTIKDEDVHTVGKIAAGLFWSLLALNLLGAYLIIGAHPAGGRGRGRAIGALATSVVAAVLAIAIHFVLREVVAAANDEVDRDLLSLRAGAYVIPVAAVLAVVAAIATLIAFAAASRRRPHLPLPAQPPAAP